MLANVHVKSNPIKINQPVQAPLFKFNLSSDFDNSIVEQKSSQHALSLRITDRNPWRLFSIVFKYAPRQ